MTTEKKKVVRLLIFGSVHGVGFRKFIKQHATRLGLVGWVRNLPEGTVEVQISGAEKAIEQLVLLSKKGPFLAEVKDIDILHEEKEFPFTEFVLRRDVE